MTTSELNELKQKVAQGAARAAIVKAQRIAAQEEVVKHVRGSYTYKKGL